MIQSQIQLISIDYFGLLQLFTTRIFIKPYD